MNAFRFLPTFVMTYAIIRNCVISKRLSNYEELLFTASKLYLQDSLHLLLQLYDFTYPQRRPPIQGSRL